MPPALWIARPSEKVYTVNVVTINNIGKIMASSKMAAYRDTLDLFQILSKEAKEFVFKSYSRMENLELSRTGYRKKLQRFEKLGLIQKRKTLAGNVFVITPKARILRSKAITKKHRTDGYATLIIFDIPEEKRNARDTLRRYLIKSGYTQIRESCFLSPFQMFDVLKSLIQELKLEKEVSVFAAKAEYHFR
ncbi:MAG: hypothetical protein KW802_02385 [Candidatus Doudnabacteria bacterium]|nr:hypothetical protein [Candidatus Doudnabacteria bacterium]